MDNELVKSYYETIISYVDDVYLFEDITLSKIKTEVIKNILEILEIESTNEEVTASVIMFFEKLDSVSNDMPADRYSSKVCNISRRLHMECDGTDDIEYSSCNHESCKDCPLACITEVTEELKEIKFNETYKYIKIKNASGFESTFLVSKDTNEEEFIRAHLEEERNRKLRYEENIIIIEKERKEKEERREKEIKESGLTAKEFNENLRERERQVRYEQERERLELERLERARFMESKNKRNC